MLNHCRAFVAGLALFFSLFSTGVFAAFESRRSAGIGPAGNGGWKEGSKPLKLTGQGMVAADPKNPAAYLARAELHDAGHEFDRAIDDYGKLIELVPDSATVYERRGEDHFRVGHFKESVADFDKVIELNPGHAPHHWQRGISLYYAGEFDKGARQFELHKTVNPEDVENAVWHFLCVARQSGVEKARQSLIPIHGDTRVPMMQVFALFGGKGTEKDVMDAVNAGNPDAAELKDRLFYAHLYLGLYEEASGHIGFGQRAHPPRGRKVRRRGLHG